MFVKKKKLKFQQNIDVKIVFCSTKKYLIYCISLNMLRIPMLYISNILCYRKRKIVVYLQHVYCNIILYIMKKKKNFCF